MNSTMHPSRVTLTLFTVFPAILLAAPGCTTPAAPRASPTTHPTTIPTSTIDPRSGLITFFEAVHSENEPAAFACWMNDIADSSQTQYVEDLVHHLITELVATSRFEKAIAAKFPRDYQEQRRQNNLTPDPAQLAAARFAVYRRLAIVSWGDDEDDGFPMVLDNHDRAAPLWKISMQQWHETTRSSVGDSILLSGWGATAKNVTTKEVLAGKFSTFQGAQEAYLKHLLDAGNDASESPTTNPTTAPSQPR